MMQQPNMYQQEQTPTQDSSGQQMVLCPVRVVYETQMLVQPGEQIQPNQTILINPQNTPPWIQNRAVPNQVIYVQQMPTNYVQQPQHFDPNQLYIQNFGYQNIQPMFVQNPQDQIRPMQMIQQNVVPNIQSNINTNIQNQRVLQNASQISHVNTMPNHNVPIARQIPHSQIAHMNEIVNNIRPPDTQNIYRHQVPQNVQEPKVQIQQNVMVPQNIQNVPRFPQPYEQNIAQIRSPSHQSIVGVPPSYQNSLVNLQQENRKAVATMTSKGNQHTPNVSVKGPQSFRPIQPRTNQIRNNGPNVISVQPTSSIIQHSMPSIVSAPRKMLPNNVHMPNSISISSSGQIEGSNIPINRKRKSESPDEVHKKVSISNQTDNPIVIKRLENVSNVNCSDVGVNTSPVHRSDNKIVINNIQITPLKPSTSSSSINKNAKIIEELSKPVKINIPSIPENIIKKNSVILPSLPILTNDKDKLIRNTVYTQARGRLLNDKEPKVETNIAQEVENKEAVQITTETSTEDKKSDQCLSVEIKSDIKHEIKPDLKPELKPDNKPDIKPEIKPVTKPEIKPDRKPEIKPDRKPDKKPDRKPEFKPEPETSKTAVKESKTPQKPTKPIKSEIAVKTEVKMETKEKKEEKASKVKSHEVKPSPKLQDDKNFILTHVLDGYVIQESNIAFPIRKPLKEKCLQNNTGESESKRDVKNEKETAIRNNSKILDISNLQIKEIEGLESSGSAESEAVKENPFKTIKLNTLKAWTADELATHLSKFTWNETVSVLQEHEIDGESLLLVSKSQLLTIGVSEEHADIICDFVKS